MFVLSHVKKKRRELKTGTGSTRMPAALAFGVENLGMFAALGFHSCDLRYLGSKQL
jgi:hypothetical protein